MTGQQSTHIVPDKGGSLVVRKVCLWGGGSQNLRQRSRVPAFKLMTSASSCISIG